MDVGGGSDLSQASNGHMLATRTEKSSGESPSVSLDRALVSHEAACILNASEEAAEIEITLFFQDRDPIGPYCIVVAPLRTLHLRFNDLADPAPVPRDTGYASIIRSSQHIVVQHTRLELAKSEYLTSFDDRISRGRLIITTRSPLEERHWRS